MSDDQERKIDPPSAPRDNCEPPEIGKVNVLEVAVGLRGYGKSTTISQRAYELARAYHGAYVIGHSLGARMPDVLPDGTKLPIEYHATLASLERGLRRKPGSWHIKVGGSADEVIHYARLLSRAIRARAWSEAGHWSRWDTTRRMDGIRATPIILLIDELIALDAAGGKTQGNRETQWFREWVFSIRHDHTALLCGIQNAAARSWLLVEQATRIYAVKARHAWALELLRASGASQEQLERIRFAEVGDIETIE